MSGVDDAVGPQPASDTTAAPSPDLARLMQAVARLPHPAFAVLDGGLWDDLPGELGKAGLSGRSLFLGAGADVEAAGPWLVALDQRAGAADTVLALVGEAPAAMFWGCQVGEAALWRHLRTLNSARVPEWAAAGEVGPPESAGAAERSAPAMFRHWGPRVLGALLPALDEAQFARVLGPAQELLFHASGYGGVQRVIRDPDWPIMPNGPLVIRTGQMLDLAQHRLAASQRRQADYLRRVAPGHVAHLHDGELQALAGKHQAEALELGIRGGREMFMWSFMRVTSVGDLSRSPDVTRLMVDPRLGPDPDARLRQVYAMRTAYLRRGG